MGKVSRILQGKEKRGQVQTRYNTSRKLDILDHATNDEPNQVTSEMKEEGKKVMVRT